MRTIPNIEHWAWKIKTIVKFKYLKRKMKRKKGLLSIELS